MNLHEKSRIMRLIDLTCLNEPTTHEDVHALIDQSENALGKVAALCIPVDVCAWAKTRMPQDVLLATVVNFPYPHTHPDQARDACQRARGEGADEIDAVLPYPQLIEGKLLEVERMLATYREACEGHTLKVILESGVLTQAHVKQASELCIKHQVDFIKTSTGKVPEGADLDSVRTMATCIQDAAAEARVGIKVSGGVRTPEDAQQYMDAVAAVLGGSMITPERMRIGASRLVGALLAE